MNNYTLHVISSKNIFGTMNSGTVRLSNLTNSDKEMLMKKHNIENMKGLEQLELSRADKAEVFKKHRQDFAKEKGFDWRKMFMADQVHKDGSYFEITKDYVEANPNGWTDIPEDILIVTDKTPGVVIGHPVADCPVITMYDMKNGAVAVGHCSAELIEKKMPMMIADALAKAYNTKDEDIYAFVSACAGPNWTYDSYPNWAQDKEMWKDSIIEENGVFKIDLRKVITKQLDERNVGMNGLRRFNLDDTITNSSYYSNSASRNNPEKFGRQFEGAFIDSVEKSNKIR